MAGEELVELKFRLADGSDIGPNKYSLVTTIASLKEFIISRWSEDKDNAPTSISDIKLINAGKILENSKTLSESGVTVGGFPSGTIVMHVVVKPPALDRKTEKQRGNSQMNKCPCSIL